MAAEPNGGILVRCSVSPDDGNSNAPSTNHALTLLNEIVKQSSVKGWDTTMSIPAAFLWDNLNAAYYLFTTGDGERALVIAIALPNGQPQVVFCNISEPIQKAARIRAEIAQVLDNMMIDSITLHGAGLNSLPNPLPFPPYLPPSATPQATALSTTQP